MRFVDRPHFGVRRFSQKVFTLFFSLLLCTAWIGGFQSVMPSWAGQYEMGIRAYQQGDYDLAIRYFRQAVDKNWENPNIRYYLADAMMRNRRFNEAQHEYQTVLAMAPDSMAGRLSRLALAKLPSFAHAAKRSNWMASGSRKSSSGSTDRLDGFRVTGEDYLSEVSDAGKYVRWSVNKGPIKLYVDHHPEGLRNFQPQYIAMVSRAMEAWTNKAFQNRLTYLPVETAQEADIKLYWVNTIDTQGHKSDKGTTYTAGLTIPQIEDDQLFGMTVKVATLDITGKPQKPDKIYAVALHELGHALGIIGHSPEKTDVMFAGGDKGVSELSTRDINTVRRLYGAEADISSSKPDKDRQDNPTRIKEYLADLTIDITKQEALIAQRDNNLNWLNMATLLFRKGSQLKKLADLSAESERQALIAEGNAEVVKAIEAATNAIAREPMDALSYYNRALYHQEFTENTELALADVNTALKYDNSEPRYHLEKAWILGKLKRKAEAMNSLQTYLQLDPTNAGSKQVNKIRSLIESI
ncbi:MAG: tetratricopeptide repeat protein [Vampirovibrio sp.]|nr:tetratricopeptide repeat protein [Vampirovibrio sp.]